MINLYTNYKSTREWDKQGADQNKVLVALVTSLKQEHAKENKTSDKSTRIVTNTTAKNPGNSTGPPVWKINLFW